MVLPKLQPEEVKFLAFEGGGGKGNAFPGAIEALSDARLNIIRFEHLRPQNIKGFSGSSAGAITALFLSCGYDHEEIRYITGHTDFDRFFDTPQIGVVPKVGGCRQESFTVNREDSNTITFIELVRRLLIRRRTFLPFSLPEQVPDLNRFLGQAMENFRLGHEGLALWAIVTLLRDKLPEATYNQIRGHPTQVALSVQQDFGIFPGCLIRDFFKKWIAIARYRVQNFGDYSEALGGLGKEGALQFMEDVYHRESTVRQLGEATFEEHYQSFGAKLAVTGTNLETSKSHIFSSDTTPRFLVADAVRISMSLPIVFKPFILKTDEDVNRVKNPSEPLRDHYLRGVWVDGGLFNNLPLHVFDNEEPRGSPKTLGLRLELEHSTDINTLFKFLSVWPLKLGFLGAGESHISRTSGNFQHTIILDIRPLELLDFNPKKSTVRIVQQRAKETTLNYFGLSSVSAPFRPPPTLP